LITGIQINRQRAEVLLISIHAVLVTHQSKSKERGDEFDIGYNSDKYGEIIEHPSGCDPFCKIRKEKNENWTALIELLMTPEELDLYGNFPDEFNLETDEI